MNEQTNYVLTHMAAERGISSDQMKEIIKDAIHSSSNLTLRKEMQSRFGKREMTAEEFIILLAEMIEQGCGN